MTKWLRRKLTFNNREVFSTVIFLNILGALCSFSDKIFHEKISLQNIILLHKSNDSNIIYTKISSVLIQILKIRITLVR